MDLQTRFLEEKKLSPFSSTFINFQHAIKGLKLTRRTLQAGFLKFVDRKDYDEVDLDRLIDYLYNKI